MSFFGRRRGGVLGGGLKSQVSQALSPTSLLTNRGRGLLACWWNPRRYNFTNPRPLLNQQGSEKPARRRKKPKKKPKTSSQVLCVSLFFFWAVSTMSVWVSNALHAFLLLLASCCWLSLLLLARKIFFTELLLGCGGNLNLTTANLL